MDDIERVMWGNPIERVEDTRLIERVEDIQRLETQIRILSEALRAIAKTQAPMHARTDYEMQSGIAAECKRLARDALLRAAL